MTMPGAPPGLTLAPRAPDADHDHLARGGRWPACYYPERPAERRTAYVWDCAACMIRLEADAHTEPADVVTTFQRGTRPDSDTTKMQSFRDARAHWIAEGRTWPGRVQP